MWHDACNVYSQQATFRRRQCMYLKKLLRLGIRKAGDDVEIGNVNSMNSQEVKEMAAKNLTDSSDSTTYMAVQESSTTKILTVQDGDHSTVLVDYAVKMAQKLDCEIIALDVSEEPMDYAGERREREIRRFQQRARRNFEALQLKADAILVKCTHIVKVGNQEEIIKALSKEDAGIRYVLLKPAHNYVDANRRQARVPVVDLNCSSL